MSLPARRDPRRSRVERENENAAGDMLAAAMLPGMALSAWLPGRTILGAEVTDGPPEKRLVLHFEDGNDLVVTGAFSAEFVAKPQVGHSNPLNEAYAAGAPDEVISEGVSREMADEVIEDAEWEEAD